MSSLRCTFAFGMLSVTLLATDIAAAASACDWTATRKRNDKEVVCHEKHGLNTPGFSFTAPEPQAKLEQCLVSVKREHIVDRVNCAEQAKMTPPAKKR